MKKFILIAVIVLAIGAIWWVAKPKPTNPPEQGVALVAVTVPALSPDAMVGKAKYNQFCASCHGADAAGQDGVAPPLVHKMYEPSHHGDMAFLMAATNGVRAHHWPFGNMPPVKGISEADIIAILAYVRELQRANGIN